MSRETVGNEARTGDLNVSGTITSGAVSNPTFTGVASFPDGSASAPSITNTGDTNTGVFFPAADTVAISTNGTERVRVKSDGLVGIGTTSPAHHLEVASANAYEPRLAIKNTNTDASPGYLIFDKSPSDNSLSDSDFIANIRFRGLTTGGSSVDIAEIRVQTEGANDATSAPGRLMFYTTPSGSTSTERMRINNAGLITGTGTSLGAWTAYTPTLGGTGWAIGNATVAGNYCQIGKIVHFTAVVVFGSTSTFGTGDLTISLPLTAGNFARHHMFGRFLDSSAGLLYGATARPTSSTVLTVYSFVSGSAGQLATVTDTVPFTWASSDEIRISGTYEAS